MAPDPIAELTVLVADRIRGEQGGMLGDDVPAIGIRVVPGSLDGYLDVQLMSESSALILNSVFETAGLREVASSADSSFLARVAGHLCGSSTQLDQLILEPIGSPKLEQLNAHLSGYQPSRRDSTIAREILDYRDVILVGPSASGKTVSATATSLVCAAQGWQIMWADMVDPAVTAEALAMRLLVMPRAMHYLAVLDNLQAGVTVAEELCGLLETCRANLGLPIAVMAVAWPSARQMAIGLLGSAIVLAAEGEEVLNELFQNAGVAEGDATKLSELSEGDVVVGSAAIQYLLANGELPDDDQIAEMVATRVGIASIAEMEPRRLLYWFASLGIYEIEVSGEYASHLDEASLTALISIGIVRSDGHFFRIGHKSLAALLARYAWRHWQSPDDPFETPPTVAVAYLRRVGDRQVKATLEKLDLVGLASTGGEDERSAVLARAWQALTVLGNLLLRHNTSDPTWSDNVASAVFASEALAQVDQRLAWEASAGYVRGRWSCSDTSRLPLLVGGPTSTRTDFDEIFRTMQDEDSARRGPHWSGLAALDIDLDRMHETWVLGLLLGFEGSALNREPVRLAQLLEIAENLQEPNGSFYPERVPWVTARVIMGLCKAGQSYNSSTVVRRACDWLRTSRPLGPYAFGTWESGTGLWNTTLMTTAMCLAALGVAGVPVHDHSVRAGLAFLREKRDEWGDAGNEIDLANALEAVLLSGGRWSSYSDELGRLLSWAQSSQAWVDAGRLASDVHDESSKVAFIATELVSIVWATVKRELPLLLEKAAGATKSIADDEVDDLDPFTSVGLREARLRCSQVEEIINENILDRERALRERRQAAPELERMLIVWRGYAQRLSLIVSQLDGASNPNASVLGRLDELGREVSGSAWRPLVPGVS